MSTEKIDLSKELQVIERALASSCAVRLTFRAGDRDEMQRLTKLLDMGIIAMGHDADYLRRILKDGVYIRLEVEFDITMTHSCDKGWQEYLAWYMKNKCVRYSVAP